MDSHLRTPIELSQSIGVDQTYRVGKLISEDPTTLLYSVADDLGKDLSMRELFPTDGTTVRRGIEVDLGDDVDFEGFVMVGKLLATINHPAIEGVDRVEEMNGTAYWIGDILYNSALTGFIRSGVEPSGATLDRIIEPVLRGLGECHRNGLVHGRITTDSVLVSTGGRPTLTGFRPTGLIRRSEVRSTNDGSGQTLIAGYSPIESYGGTKSPPDPRTDLYCVGAIAHELVTGNRVPDARERIDNPRGIALVGSEYESRIGLHWAQVIDAMLEPAAVDRPPSTFEVLADLSTGNPILGAGPVETKVLSDPDESEASDFEKTSEYEVPPISEPSAVPSGQIMRSLGAEKNDLPPPLDVENPPTQDRKQFKTPVLIALLGVLLCGFLGIVWLAKHRKSIVNNGQNSEPIRPAEPSLDDETIVADQLSSVLSGMENAERLLLEEMIGNSREPTELLETNNRPLSRPPFAKLDTNQIDLNVSSLMRALEDADGFSDATSGADFLADRIDMNRLSETHRTVAEIAITLADAIWRGHTPGQSAKLTQVLVDGRALPTTSRESAALRSWCVFLDSVVWAEDSEFEKHAEIVIGLMAALEVADARGVDQEYVPTEVLRVYAHLVSGDFVRARLYANQLAETAVGTNDPQTQAAVAHLAAQTVQIAPLWTNAQTTHERRGYRSSLRLPQTSQAYERWRSEREGGGTAWVLTQATDRSSLLAPYPEFLIEWFVVCLPPDGETFHRDVINELNWSQVELPDQGDNQESATPADREGEGIAEIIEQ